MPMNLQRSRLAGLNPPHYRVARESNLAKPVATVIGIISILIGFAGFLSPHLMGSHLSFAHNVIHLFSGAISLYFGFGATLKGARMFCLVLGAIYLILAIVGFVGGSGSGRILTVIPGALVLGVVDHIIHAAIGALYLVGGGTTPLQRR